MTNIRILVTLVVLAFVTPLTAQIYTPSGVIQGSSSGTYSRVGIGTNAPSSKLEVSPNINIGGITVRTWTNQVVGGGTSTTPYALRVRHVNTEFEPQSEDDVFRIMSGGNTLIGAAVQNFTTSLNEVLKVDRLIGVYNNNDVYIRIGHKVNSTGPDGLNGISWSGTTTGVNQYFNFVAMGQSVPVISLSPLGRVGINTTDISDGDHALYVHGSILSEEIVVKLKVDWPDYVFAPTYQLPTLAEIEAFIQMNGHLPEVPTAAEVEQDGLRVGEMEAILLKKVEELTLLMIEQQKEIEALKTQLAEE